MILSVAAKLALKIGHKYVAEDRTCREGKLFRRGEGTQDLRLSRFKDLGESKVGGVHLSCALVEIVRLVDKECVPAALGEEALYIDHRVEKVVEIADNHVGKLGVGQRKLVGTDVKMISHKAKILKADNRLFHRPKA